MCNLLQLKNIIRYLFIKAKNIKTLIYIFISPPISIMMKNKTKQIHMIIISYLILKLFY